MIGRLQELLDAVRAEGILRGAIRSAQSFDDASDHELARIKQDVEARLALKQARDRLRELQVEARARWSEPQPVAEISDDELSRQIEECRLQIRELVEHVRCCAACASQRATSQASSLDRVQ